MTSDGKFLTKENIKDIQYKIIKLNEEAEFMKRKHKEKMVETGNNIEYLKKVLYEKCNHIKVIDYDNVDEHTHYYCSVCLSAL